VRLKGAFFAFFPCFLQYLGCDRARQKKEGVEFFVCAFLAPFSFSGYSSAFDLASASLMCFFSSRLPPPHSTFSYTSRRQRWHFDDERSRLQRDRRRRSCPPRRKVTLWTPRGDYSRRPWCDRSFLPLLEKEEEEEDEEKKTECVVFFPPRRRQK